MLYRSLPVAFCKLRTPQDVMAHNFDVSTLTSEERARLFLALFETDPSLPNAFTTDQRRRLHAVLIAIEPSIAPFPDARSAVPGITNTQVSTFVICRPYALL